ncbi:MAG: HEAT repeat domain-containing protein [Bryobacterales bacterium]|nr:HEAT repeat domain-containing protein [Bryobacterales bacterium]
MRIPEAAGIPEGIDIADPATRMELLLKHFDSNPKLAIEELSALCQQNLALFFGMAYRWLTRTATPRNAPARQLASMAVDQGLLLPLLAESSGLTQQEATLLIHRFAAVSPGVECTLLERYLEIDSSLSVPPGLFLVLDVVASMDSVGRTNSLLVRFLRSPNPKVRSKVADSLLRMTKSADTAANLLSDPDDRVRANIIEGLWPQAHSTQVQQLLRQHADSPVPRISMNALIGLYRGGDPDAVSRILERATVPNPPMQRAAIWTMGYLAHEEFESPLRDLLRSGNSFFRGHVLRALVRINATRKPKVSAQDGVRAANSAIGQILAGGAMEWNRWRENCREPRPSLEGDSFYQMDLTGADLSFCCLRGADFEQATLNLCNLFGADLRDVNFRGAKLNRSDLRAAELGPGTCFVKAEFHGAAIYGLRFDEAKAEGAEFDSSPMDVQPAGATPVEPIGQGSALSPPAVPAA